jgi:hypothetical protein
MKTITAILDEVSLAIITAFPAFKRRYFDQPKLTIKLFPGEHHYCQKKWPVPDISNSAFFYELCWGYRIEITNTSKHAAINPLICFNRVLPHSTRLDALNHYVPIVQNETVTLEGEYKVLEAHAEGFSCNTKGVPSDLNKVKILLTYENGTGTKFYTVFDPAFKSNTYERVKPIEFSC